jgi:hypothetical protein
MAKFVLVLVSSCLVFAQSTSPNQAPSFSLSLKAPESVKAGSYVVLEITLTNTTDHQIYVAELLGGGELNYDIQVRDSTGKSAQETPFGHKLHTHTANLGGSIVRRTVDPGKTVVSHANLNTVYELKRPGDYTVQVSSRDPSTHTVVQTNTITLTVAP